MKSLAGFLTALAFVFPSAAVADDVIDWGSGVSDRAIQYRDDHNISPRRNVAVFVFEHADGRRGTIAIDSEPFSKGGEPPDKPQGHSERRLAKILRGYGIRPDQVKVIYSELQPCMNPGAFCSNLLRREFPKAQVFYSFEYGSTADSRRAGTTALRGAVNDHYRARAAAGNVMRGPGFFPREGALPDALARPGIRAGGVDFRTLELRYVSAANGDPRRGVRYALRGLPTDGPSDPAAGLAAAKQASDAFFTWLALPPQTFWVNLNPNEPNRIMDPQLARTDAGKVLLEADLQMKKTAARIIHPDTAVGAEFWRRMEAIHGNKPEAPPCFSFRSWIVPLPATVRETGDELYVLDAPLTVMSVAQDYGAAFGPCPQNADPAIVKAKEDLWRTLVLPRVAQVVNTAPEYAALRRVYVSRVAAEWFRRHGDRRSKLGRLVDSGRIDRWALNPPWDPSGVFNEMLRSIREGEFSVQRTLSDGTVTYTRIYQFGGVDLTRAPRTRVGRKAFKASYPRVARTVRRAVKRPAADASRGDMWLGARSGKARKGQPRIRFESRRAARGSLALAVTTRDGRVRAGDLVNYRLRVKNLTDLALADVRICDRLPAELEYVASSRRRQLRDGWHCWELPRLAAGGSQTVRLTARVLGGAHGRIRTVATAAGVRAQRTISVQGGSVTPGGVTG